MDRAFLLEHVIPTLRTNTNHDSALFILEIGCFGDTGSSAVIQVRNRARAIKMSTVVVVESLDMFLCIFYSCMAKEELARFVVGNDSGMCKAALADNDAPRACSVTSRRRLHLQSSQHRKTHRV